MNPETVSAVAGLTTVIAHLVDKLDKSGVLKRDEFAAHLQIVAQLETEKGSADMVRLVADCLAD